MQSASVSLTSSASSSLIDAESGPFRTELNHRAFAFSHFLANDPLFDLSRLADLAKTVIAANKGDRNHYVLCKAAESVPNVSKQWTNFQPLDRVHEAIRHIRESGSWVLITGAQIDPDYQTLLDNLLYDLEIACGIPLRAEILWSCFSIFVGSPNSVTHYHMDSETNFLFQIHGNKEAHLFDRNDREILSEEDIETFNAVDGSHIQFRDEFHAKEKLFGLAPGTGLHIPVNAPHWVKNLDDYSVTMSILFYMREETRRAWIYQVNHILRKLRINPTPPGKAPFVDNVKSGLIGGLTTRSPRDKQDVLRSGYHWITKPARSAYRLARARK
ncbi:MAG TPA: cupin-like domain-containing protein [Methylocella sp.]|nr:cupin-like domain-containing protein [Methylocella sp.]